MVRLSYINKKRADDRKAYKKTYQQRPKVKKRRHELYLKRKALSKLIPDTKENRIKAKMYNSLSNEEQLHELEKLRLKIMRGEE